MAFESDDLTPLQQMRQGGLSYVEATPEVQDFDLHGTARLRAWGHRMYQRILRAMLAPLSARGRVVTPASDIYYLGHHKCASNWMRCFLLKLSPYIQYDYVVQRGQRSTNFVSLRPTRTIYLNVNADVESMEAVPGTARGFHLIRDPRDALISEYFSRKLSHGVWGDWHIRMREYLQRHSKEEGLIYLMDHHIYFMQMERWDLHQHEHILDVRYEDLIRDELAGFSRILEHLHVEIPEPIFRRIVRGCSFESLSGGRKRGVEDQTKHFRKGVAGDWEYHMPPGGRVYEAFKDRFSDLMDRLDYEV